MDQQQVGMELLRQFPDMRQEAFVGPAVFEGNKDFPIHGGLQFSGPVA